MVERFSITHCTGIIGINDTSHESYGSWESNGYHGDEPFVVHYWKGHYVSNGGNSHWQLNETDVADAYAHCERLNTEYPVKPEMSTENRKLHFTLGQVATINAHIYKLRPYDAPDKVTWVTNELDKPMQVMIIGWVYVYEGKMERGYFDYDGGYQEPDVFHPTNSILAYRVQPYEKSGRWRNPLTVLENQITQKSWL
jgi:hypothetical protein